VQRKDLNLDSVYEAFKSNWFPVARSIDIDKPRSVVLFDKNLVVFRDTNGIARTAEGHCIHRGADLSKGQVKAEGIECPYHGWVFNGESGNCVSVPALKSEEVIPKTAKIEIFSTIEKYEHVWTTLRASTFEIPEFPALENLNLNWMAGEPILTSAGFMMAIENFRDMAHFPFVHKETMGNVSKIFPEMEVEQVGREVKTSLFYPSQKNSEFSGMGDAWMHYHSFAPGVASIFYDYMDAGKRFLINFTSPVSKDKCYVYWAVAVDEDFTGGSLQEIFEVESKIFSEDTPILNSIKPKEIHLDGTVKEVSCRADVYTLAYRRACVNAALSILNGKE